MNEVRVSDKYAWRGVLGAVSRSTDARRVRARNRITSPVLGFLVVLAEADVTVLGAEEVDEEGDPDVLRRDVEPGPLKECVRWGWWGSVRSVGSVGSAELGRVRWVRW